MNIVDAVRDSNLFRPYITGTSEGSLDSWGPWCSFLKALYGLPLDPSEYDLVRESTGRDPEKLPAEGFSEALVLCGRRSGKSKICGLIGAAEAVLGGREKHLDPGEIGLVAILSPTRAQSRIIHSYAQGAFASTPILEGELGEEQRESFKLTNGAEISIITGDPRKARGYTLLAAIIDEVAMFGLSEESKVRSDTELIRAIRPSLATTGGRLVSVGTPYRAAGYAYATYRNHYGNDSGDILVWNAPSTVMNPTLSKKIVERALVEDPIAAAVEYAVTRGLFREDVDSYVERSVVEACVVSGRMELAPRGEVTYSAFCDVSGGRRDDAALAVAHQEGPIVVVDLLERYKAPHNPHLVVARMVETMRRYGVTEAVGDSYAAEWTKTTFEEMGIAYRRATRNAWKDAVPSEVAKPKSALYLELLPRLSSGTVELPDDETLVAQLANLQRRTRSGGRDSVDHPPGAKDDCANATAGAVVCALEQETTVGIGDQPAPGPYAGPMLDPLAQSMMEDMRANPPRPDHPNDQFQEWLWRQSRGQRCSHPYLE